MSLPREVLPGRSYLITRRCTQRQLLMRPDAETNQAFLYCLAEAAARYKIDVLFTVAMSNHHHTGIYDPLGNYPAFLEHFHKLFAKCQNALRGRWENFWAAEQTSVVRLTSAQDVLEKLVYALTNPVKDHLVEKALQWPGVSSYSAMVENRALRATRPQHFFRETGAMPEAVTLHFARPVGFEHLTHAAWAALLEQRVKEAEDSARSQRRRSGLLVLGAKAVLRQSWVSRPKSVEPRRKLSPRVAAKNKWKRIEALLHNKAFLLAYHDARQAFQLKMRTVVFPDGTYWLRRFASVLCRSDISPIDYELTAA
jgi:putative transposase